LDLVRRGLMRRAGPAKTRVGLGQLTS
jgi:hypothetical protein